MKTTIAYKLFRKLKSGEVTPLFINKTARLPIGEWMKAESHRTKGFAYRPQWHCTGKPVAPHLTEKGRVWMKIEMKDFEVYARPEHQGGKWFLADNIKIIGELSEEELIKLRS